MDKDTADRNSWDSVKKKKKKSHVGRTDEAGVIFEDGREPLPGAVRVKTGSTPERLQRARS